MLPSIEDLVDTFDQLSPAAGNRWSVAEVFANRLYLSRDTEGRHSIFIAGDKASFGKIPRFAGVAYSDSISVMPTGATLGALRLTTTRITTGNRAMAHVAYELLRQLEAKADTPNTLLVDGVRWILELLGGREVLLDDELQRGLLGELIFLRRLLQHARRVGAPASHALESWFGSDRSKRDFAGQATAVEVKFTTLDTRRHHIHGLAQLEPQGDEKVFVFSVGAKLDFSAPRKLPDYVADVRALLVNASGAVDEDLNALFVDRLEAYGYREEHAQAYRAEPGVMNLHLRPAMFRETDLDRVRISSFKNDALPSMVLDVSYVLDIKATELDEASEAEVLSRLLSV